MTKKILIGLYAFFHSFFLYAQNPYSSTFKNGKLDNNLTYYILHNESTPHKANLYLIQKAGSVQEDDNQRGISLFLLQMMGDGSEHFPNNTLFKSLDKIGIRWGRDFNSYVAADETVYSIENVSTTLNSNIDLGLLVLSDFSGRLTLSSESMEEERAAINEMWEKYTSPSQKILKRNLPTLYPASKYGSHLPSGNIDFINNITLEMLHDFYKKWYRPDLLGIMVIGDVDINYVEEKIKEYFSEFENPQENNLCNTFAVPNNETPIYVIDQEKGIVCPSLDLMFKHEVMSINKDNVIKKMEYDYHLDIICKILNSRFKKLTLKEDCPYDAVIISEGQYLISKTCNALSFKITPKHKQDITALQIVMSEIANIHKYGFSEKEIKEAIGDFLNEVQTTYTKGDKQDYTFYIEKIKENFLDGTEIIDVETEYKLKKELADNIPFESFVQTFIQITGSIEKNFVLLGMYPKEDNIVVPTDELLKKAVETGYYTHH